MLLKMSSSWRECTLECTIDKARKLSRTLGITRVTDITWLDKIGIPVFSSIRPDAVSGSLCVNAGKGRIPAEAKAGAYMEAIEFAMAEFRRNTNNIERSTPRKISDNHGDGFNFVDFCPIYDLAVKPDEYIQAIYADSIFSEEKLLVPAELVFSPFEEIEGQVLFGTSTNGLCSGNSIEEATLHGLSEVIERDIQAFNYISDTSVWVELSDLPHNLKELVNKVRMSELEVALRYTKNDFGLPYFQGFILEKNSSSPIAISHGTGLHPSASIAAVRAISEAAQSRLSYIHGGRDDLIERERFFRKFDKNVEIFETDRMYKKVLDRNNTVSFSSIPDVVGDVDSIESATNFLYSKLQERGISKVLRVNLSPDESSGLYVAKIIVPNLESFNPGIKRVGPRLLELIKNL